MNGSCDWLILLTLVDLTAEDPVVHQSDRSSTMAWSTTRAGTQYYDLEYQRLRQAGLAGTRGNI